MMPGMSTYVWVVTSPATCTWPVVISVSTATRLPGSSLIMESRMASLIWSAILSGWPSVTDSDVKRRRATSALPSLWVTAVSLSWAAGSLAATSHFVQSGGHQIPHDVGQRFLGPARDRRDRSVTPIDNGLVVRCAEAEPVPDGIDDEQVAPLPGQLSLGCGRRGVGLGGEPGQDLPRGDRGDEPSPFGIMIVWNRTGGVPSAPCGGQPGQDVRVLGQRDRLRRPPVLLDLGRAARRRPVVRHRGG